MVGRVRRVRGSSAAGVVDLGVQHQVGVELPITVLDGLLRVYMHAGDGRQVTVRYARAGDLLGVPSLVGGPAPVFVQAIVPAIEYGRPRYRAA